LVRLTAGIAVNFDRLPRGVTGFIDRGSSSRVVDPKLFKAACHLVAVRLGGSVSDFDAGLLARSYYACTLKISRDHISVLGNATYPLIGFVRAGQYGFRELSFLPCAEVGREFTKLTDFKPLDYDFLTAALAPQYLSELAPVELDQIKHWQRRGAVDRIGDVVFNAWD
jgi:hypothetical protein